MTKQEYVKQVGKGLRCSSVKKSEILKQLDSDIEIALGEGRELSKILEEMGQPEILAEEFNENMDEKERKNEEKVFHGRKRRRILCIFGVILAVLAAIAGLAYWMFPKGRDIEKSKSFDSAQVRSLTEEVIELFSAGEYETLEDYACEELKKALEQTGFHAIRDYISPDWGELRTIGNIYMVEIHERNKVYAAVQVSASYENVNVTYTLSFNRQMQLYGFYIR